MRKKLSCRVSPSFMSIIQVFYIEKIKYCKSDFEMQMFSSKCLMCIRYTRLRYKDNIAKCRFFVVLGDNQALLGMPNIILLDMLKVVFEVMRSSQVRIVILQELDNVIMLILSMYRHIQLADQLGQSS